MLFVPNGGGWPVPAGQGTIRQGSKGRILLRKRTIQHYGALSNRYLGSNLIANPQARLLKYNNEKLRRLAEYWAISLTGAQRAQWDANAPGMMNGFDYFMEQNLCGYYAYNSLLPILGQNIGDTTSPADWDFSPAKPTTDPVQRNPSKSFLILTFTGGDRFTLTNLTGHTDATAFADHVTMYSTRPYNTTLNERSNPLIRLGRFVATGGGSLFFFTDPNDTTTAPLKTLWERIIGGAISGQKITYGYRFNSVRTPFGKTGPLARVETTVL